MGYSRRRSACDNAGFFAEKGCWKEKACESAGFAGGAAYMSDFTNKRMYYCRHLGEESM